METLRPKAAPAVLAIKLEKPGKLKWRAGHFLVIENDVPRVMKPAELEAEYEHADAPAPVAAPARRPRAGGRPGRRGPKKARPESAGPRRVPEPEKPRGTRKQYTPDQMAEARKLIEGGVSIPEAAKQVGAEYPSVYRWAKANGWEAK